MITVLTRTTNYCMKLHPPLMKKWLKLLNDSIVFAVGGRSCCKCEVSKHWGGAEITIPDENVSQNNLHLHWQQQASSDCTTFHPVLRKAAMHDKESNQRPARKLNALFPHHGTICNKLWPASMIQRPSCTMTAIQKSSHKLALCNLRNIYLK